MFPDGLQAGEPGFDFQNGKKFLSFTASRTTLGPSQPPIQRAISPGVKWPGREATHSRPTSIKVKNGGAVPLLPRRIALNLIYSDNFTFQETYRFHLP
jgi:hypothetical protein